MATAVLSTTVKATARAKAKEEAASTEMDTVSHDHSSSLFRRLICCPPVGRQARRDEGFDYRRRRDEVGRAYRFHFDRNRGGCYRLCHTLKAQAQGRALFLPSSEPLSRYSRPALLHLLPLGRSLRARPTCRLIFGSGFHLRLKTPCRISNERLRRRRNPDGARS